MEISFANESVNNRLRNNTNIRQNVTASTPREDKLDSVSENIRSGLKAAQADPEQLLEQTMEAGAQGNAIDDAHDFNMSRIMELLSDPLLQEDI